MTLWLIGARLTNYVKNYEHGLCMLSTRPAPQDQPGNDVRSARRKKDQVPGGSCLEIGHKASFTVSAPCRVFVHVPVLD